LVTITSKYGVKISGVQFSLKLRTAEAAWACNKQKINIYFAEKRRKKKKKKNNEGTKRNNNK
jgi:hypothetical protein